MNPDDADTKPAITPDQLDHRAQHAYYQAGRWLAATFDLDLIGSRRDALAAAEKWAARGLDCERKAREMRRSFEQVSEND